MQSSHLRAEPTFMKSSHLSTSLDSSQQKISISCFLTFNKRLHSIQLVCIYQNDKYHNMVSYCAIPDPIFVFRVDQGTLISMLPVKCSKTIQNFIYHLRIQRGPLKSQLSVTCSKWTCLESIFSVMCYKFMLSVSCLKQDFNQYVLKLEYYQSCLS